MTTDKSLPDDIDAALAVLALTSLSRSRPELARRVAACHPASRPWGARQTAAYRILWRALRSERRDDTSKAA
jgi:hypothetical protein